MSQLTVRKRHLGEALMREAICDAAVAVLSEVGFAALTMDRVAEAAEVSKGTLYNYFADKDALVLAAIEASFEPLHRHLAQLFADREYCPASLVEAAHAILEHVDERQGLGRVLTGGDLSVAIEQRLRYQRQEVLAHMARVIELARQRGLLRSPHAEPQAMARVLVLTIQGMVRERILHPQDSPALAEEAGFLADYLVKPWFLEYE